ncbi:MAG: M17 family peptidase N-terminal domain-containing protein, partial [Microcystaceae cyanobacterium]
MEIRGTDHSQLTWLGDALALGFFENAIEITGDLAQLDRTLQGTLQELIAEMEFTGKAGQKAVTRVGSHSPIRKIILVGLGKIEAFKRDTLSLAGAAIARIAKKEKVKSLGISLPLVEQNGAETAAAISEGILLGLHQDHRFKSEAEDGEIKLETVDLLGLGEQVQAIADTEKIISGVILARELVAAPANLVTPITFAETAQH